MMKQRFAIVHDYCYQFGGAEKVVETFLEMFPHATLYTSIFIPEKFSSSPIFMKAWQEGRVKTSFMQSFMNNSVALRFFKHLFWLYPIAMSVMVVKNSDAVIISSSYCAKNIRIQDSPKIVHYCHSPSRYLNGLIRETDMKTVSPILKFFIPFFTFWLKWMDKKSVSYLNSKKTVWVTNSKHIQETVRKVYKTDSIVVYPPIDISRFGSVERNPNTSDPFYFHFGRISFHKKIEIIIQTCLNLRKKVVIAGKAGFQPEMDKLTSMIHEAEEKDSTLKGVVRLIDKRMTDEEISEYLKTCKAFLFPAKEDSGMIPVEVMSSGTPVIAYGAGGALEFVREGVNGILFKDQSPEGMAQGIKDFEEKVFEPSVIKQTAMPFRKEVFISTMNELITGKNET